MEIDSPEALEEVMEKINSGDRKAASASYRLVSDINMKGSKLQPIGISESLPFSGVHLCCPVPKHPPHCFVQYAHSPRFDSLPLL